MMHIGKFRVRTRERLMITRGFIISEWLNADIHYEYNKLSESEYFFIDDIDNPLIRNFPYTRDEIEIEDEEGFNKRINIIEVLE